jgi:uncharacterized cofD-like protein
MVALSKDEALLGRLFQYRFHAGRGLVGHNFGNLFLAALTHVTGDFTEAIRVSSKVLAIRGRIFPSTLSNVHLVATLENGRTVHGETRITASRGAPIKKLKLSSNRVRPLAGAIEAIKEADLILLGPGSLYTSILPNLLIPGIRQALAKSKARVVLLLNLMTQPGETDRMMGIDHLNALVRHAGSGVVDAVLVNSTGIPAPLISHYAETNSEPVAVDRAALEAVGVEVHEADLLAADGDLIRHDSEKLAAAVLGLGESLKTVHLT